MLFMDSTTIPQPNRLEEYPESPFPAKILVDRIMKDKFKTNSSKTQAKQPTSRQGVEVIK